MARTGRRVWCDRGMNSEPGHNQYGNTARPGALEISHVGSKTKHYYVRQVTPRLIATGEARTNLGARHRPSTWLWRSSNPIWPRRRGAPTPADGGFCRTALHGGTFRSSCGEDLRLCFFEWVSEWVGTEETKAKANRRRGSEVKGKNGEPIRGILCLPIRARSPSWDTCIDPCVLGIFLCNHLHSFPSLYLC